MGIFASLPHSSAYSHLLGYSCIRYIYIYIIDGTKGMFSPLPATKSTP